MVQNAEEAAGTFLQYTSHLEFVAVARKEEDSLPKMKRRREWKISEFRS